MIDMQIDSSDDVLHFSILYSHVPIWALASSVVISFSIFKLLLSEHDAIEYHWNYDPDWK